MSDYDWTSPVAIDPVVDGRTDGDAGLASLLITHEDVDRFEELG